MNKIEELVLKGALDEAVVLLEKTLDKKDLAPLATAAVYIQLANINRLQLTVSSSSPVAHHQSSKGLGVKAMTGMLGRAEDLLVRALEIREQALEDMPEDETLKQLVGQAKMDLCMLQYAYGNDVFALHEEALELFSRVRFCFGRGEIFG